MSSARRLVVDGLNVVGSRPDGWWKDRDAGVIRLASQLRAWADATATEVDVVVDGRPIEGLGEGGCGPMTVHYAPRPGPDAADDRIVELVAESSGPVTVVTADKDLRGRVTALGADVLGPRELLRRVGGAST